MLLNKTFKRYKNFDKGMFLETSVSEPFSYFRYW